MRVAFFCAMSINGQPPAVWPARDEADALAMLLVAARFAEDCRDVTSYVPTVYTKDGDGHRALWRDEQGRTAAAVIGHLLEAEVTD